MNIVSLAPCCCPANPRSPAAIRKVRLPPQRIHFVSFLGSPQLPDLRLKLLVNGRNLQARGVGSRLAVRVALAVRLPWSYGCRGRAVAVAVRLP